MKVLVTGASGFIGQSLCEHLQSSGLSVRAQMRRRQASAADYDCLIGELDDPAFLPIALAGVDVVIHLAGRAHQFGKDAANLNAMMAVNRDLTVRLAAEAERNGVKRFVFVSSIGVNGVETDSASIDERSPPNPIKDYALSKHEAEIALSARYIDQSGPMDLVIIRPPLVYAANAPGNFRKLLKLVDKGIPLPFSGVANQRSMISLNNLTDFMRVCATHPSAGGELFVVSDGQDFSLPEILQALFEGKSKAPRLFYFPVTLMSAAARLVGKGALMTQLCGSFVINSEKARTLLNWVPPFSARDELVKSARDFK
ncbi:N-acetyl-alpha-D-glucosaminyl-diphospho-ditrans, octacis-undecaprenol 4-epimerase [Pseudomonas fluorescens]|uniref:NAD-dependent epimerase/dehydratase family protein n=1 Tax=Pseudomonas fluorescens TaxID=294 RepID=UPI001241F2CF|nr:NAD-dependent epimerase/dehydratase family protein [Pseudomonas fluorescens]VVP12032.1 N-acetyl-alpha-D-glucosaminyl-diphospho-ditrans, octacis-undecaprenol 4-epimerase [Pseudomonas fluorescens]